MSEHWDNEGNEHDHGIAGGLVDTLYWYCLRNSKFVVTNSFNIVLSTLRDS